MTGIRKAIIFSALLAFCTVYLHAVPLEGGFNFAPDTNASPVERAAVYKIARTMVLAAAAKYENVPYRFGGTDRNGMDCSGFVFASFRDALGISVPRSSAGLYSWTKKIEIEEALPGDLVFFKTAGTDRITHVGIYVGDRRFIHSASEGPETGVIYSSLDERYWSLAYAGAGRVFPADDTSASEEIITDCAGNLQNVKNH